MTAPVPKLSVDEITKIKAARSASKTGSTLMAKPRPYHIERLVMQTFNRNNLGQQDLQYMAQALLQLLDKCHELEARVKAMESETPPA